MAEIDNLEVTSKIKAAKSGYTKTLVIDLSGENQAMANQIAQLISGEVSENLPEGEARPQSDILIIAGKQL